MTHTETKFAYRHKPTGKWVFFISFWDICLLDEFTPEGMLYKARNVIEEDLLNSTMNGERYAALNFSEFELVEIEIEYILKV